MVLLSCLGVRRLNLVKVQVFVGVAMARKGARALIRMIVLVAVEHHLPRLQEGPPTDAGENEANGELGMGRERLNIDE